MLALTRKKNEAIIIGGDIKITVIDIKDGKVRLGIEAPKDVNIHREELYIDIKNENESAKDNLENSLAGLKQLFGGGKGK